MHKPILIRELSLSFSHKTCFDHFSTEIHPGSRIALIGRNGCGKSTLLKMLAGNDDVSTGEIHRSPDLMIASVPQLVVGIDDCSGGERFNKALTAALAQQPDVLLLDEPTNHLDTRNRQNLMRMLKRYEGTLIIATHDTALVRACLDTLWHIEDEKINVFQGDIDDYWREHNIKRHALESQLAQLKREEKDCHQRLMKEQKRAAKSKQKGQKSIDQKKWPTIVSHAKARKAEQTSGNKRSAISEKKTNLVNELAQLRSPEIIIPKFRIDASGVYEHNLISVTNGEIGYTQDKSVLENINLNIQSKDRLAILGDNGSGKTTLIKALLNHPGIMREGEWVVPENNVIGYLDQHYQTLDLEQSVLACFFEAVPDWSEKAVRSHLADFLFRNNTTIDTLVKDLSGGEKARLSLALIAAKTPKLLILDEITNNLDFETKQHVIQIIRAYPGTLIVISHDSDFLAAISIERSIVIHDGIVE